MTKLILPNLSSPPILSKYDAGFIYWDYGLDKTYIWQGNYWIEIQYNLSGLTGTTQNKFTYEIIGDNTTQLFQITHTLNSTNVNIYVYDFTTKNRIFISESIINENQIMLEFNHPPSIEKKYIVTIFS